MSKGTVIAVANRLLRYLTTAALILGSVLPLKAEMGPPVSADKKLIAFAQNQLVDTTYLREHIAEIEDDLALDGVIIALYSDDWTGRRTGQEDRYFGGHHFSVADFRQGIQDLQNTQFSKFKHNFIQFATSARGATDPSASEDDANLDWYDPNWSVVANNAAVLATVAREAGLEGLWLDVEGYQPSPGPWGAPFNYRKRPDQSQRSIEEISPQVRKRGQEFMAAIVAAYPDITIVVIPQTGEWDGLQYELLPAFVDGMLESLGPQTTLINGLERGYSLRTYAEFLSLRVEAETDGRAKSQAGPLFDRMRYGMGIWPDHPTEEDDAFKFHLSPAEFSRNYRTPEALEHSLYYALTAVDPGSYVWLFIWQQPLWFRPDLRQARDLGEFPAAYREALRNCRKPHDLSWVAENVDIKPPITPEDLAAHGQSILLNGDLEEWADGAPVHWLPRGQGPDIAQEQEQVHSGTSAARLTTAWTEDSNHVWIDQLLPAVPYRGKTITVGIWMKCSLEDGGPQVFDFAEGAAEPYQWPLHYTEGPDVNGWRFCTSTKKIRPNADQVGFRLGAHLIHGISIYLDEAQAVVVAP